MAKRAEFALIPPDTFEREGIATNSVSPPPTNSTSASSVPRQRHVEMLVLSGIAIALSFVLRVTAGETSEVERVSFSALPGLPLPKTCFSREIFGVECPGCGLTRSFVFLAHGDWDAAWKMHRLGWLFFISAALQIPYRLHALYSKNGPLLPLPLAKAFGSFLIAALILNWVWGIVFPG